MFFSYPHPEAPNKRRRLIHPLPMFFLLPSIFNSPTSAQHIPFAKTLEGEGKINREQQMSCLRFRGRSVAMAIL
jgi:hypothetical protein